MTTLINKEKKFHIVYLILAHNNPDTLGRMINALTCNWAHFFIHIDKKADIKEFLPFISAKQNVHISANRIRVFWGGYSQVQATLNLMHEAINSGIEFKYAVLLSGSHYPIKNNEYILKKLQNSNCEYLDFAKTNEVGSEFKTNAYCWYDYAFFNPRTVFFKSKLLNMACRTPGALANLMFRKIIPILYKRRMVKNITPYTGANWWALSKSCVKYILDFSETNRSYVNFFRFAIQPDETFFHTIICNSNFKLENKNITLQSLIGKDIGQFSKLRGLSLTFTKCSPQGDPKILTTTDFSEINKEMNYFGYPQLFARKFDPKASSKLLNIIDKEILNQNYNPHERLNK